MVEADRTNGSQAGKGPVSQTQSGGVEYLDALRIVLDHCRLLLAEAGFRSECVPLLNAHGRVMAEVLAADRDQPPFSRSTRDGFACQAAAWNQGGWLNLAGQVRAGQTWDGVVGPGEAVEIMTGAPVPAGADWVAMVEDAEAGGGRIRRRPGSAANALPGGNLVAAGAEAKRGDPLLNPGVILDATRIGLAASIGAADVRVFQEPGVAILSTGDELVTLDRAPAQHQIRNSNSYSLAALVQAGGGRPLIQPIAPDDPGLLRKALEAALQADLLLLSGGVSMGKYDFVEPVLSEMGAEFFFTGVRIQPGKPLVFGRIPGGRVPGGGRYFFGLPGNPVSAIVTFLLFVQPLLQALGGAMDSSPHFSQATLRGPVAASPKLTRFLPARMESAITGKGIEVTVIPVRWRSSGDLAGAGTANCLLVVPPAAGPLAPGSVVTVLRLD